MTTGFSDPTLGTLVILHGAVYLVGLALGTIAWFAAHLADLNRERVTLGLAAVIVAAGVGKFGWDSLSGGWADADWIWLLGLMGIGSASAGMLGWLGTQIQGSAATSDMSR